MKTHVKPPFAEAMERTRSTKTRHAARARQTQKGGGEELPSVLNPILEEMTKSFEKIDSLTRKTGRELVRAWYNVGLRVAEVQRHESKYGAHAVIRLAEEL